MSYRLKPSSEVWRTITLTCTVSQTVKKSAKVIIERYYPKLTLDFETNKRICDEIAIIASKRLRNKVRHPSLSPLPTHTNPP
jgi:small subunit ribosomal protein S17e